MTAATLGVALRCPWWKGRSVWHVSGSLLTIAFATLSLASWQGTVPYWLFCAAHGMAWCALLIAAAAAAAWRSAQPMTAVIVGYALAARLVAALALPIYEDDGARYLWDGWQLSTGHDPYAAAPEVWFAVSGLPPWTQDILDRINHPHIRTVYSPVCQAVFAAAATLSPGSWWAWKALLCLAELSTLYLVVKFLPKQTLLWYAWCPLGLFETWINSHPDALAVLPLTAGLAVMARRPACGGLLLGMATATRIQMVPVVVIWLLNGSWRRIAGAVAVVSLIYLPLVAGGSDVGIGATRLMANTWEFNSFLPAIMRPVLGQVTPMCMTALGLSGILGIALWARSRHVDPNNAALMAMIWWLGCSPVVNPWYALAMLPLLTSGWWTAIALGICAALPLSYVRGVMSTDGTQQLFDHAWWIRPGEIGLIGLIGGITFLVMRHASQAAHEKLRTPDSSGAVPKPSRR